MKPPDFHYVAARSLDQAVDALTEFDGAAKVLAGGQSLVPMLNLRLLAPAALVDINHVPDLVGARETNGSITIGAMTCHREVAADPIVHRRAPILGHAASFIGYPAIRNRGTIGGSLAHADPVAEMPCVVLALDAELIAVGPDGERLIPAREFFAGYFTTALAPAEILTGIRIEPDELGARWSFLEFARKTGDFAIAAVAATALVEEERLQRPRVAIAAAADRPVRGQELEHALAGLSLGDAQTAIKDRLVRSAVVAEARSEGWNRERSEIAGILAERAIAEIASPGAAG